MGRDVMSSEVSMGGSKPTADVPLHFVCTRSEARNIVDGHERFWVSNCGCREIRGKCERSRIDVCLQFYEKTAAGDSGLKEISRDQVEAVLMEAETQHLVTRPFRDEQTKSRVEGICFCCDDCCGYFVDPGGYECEKGAFTERTIMDRCTHCGLCADVCYFGVRKMIGGMLLIHENSCYGCGLCLDVCPERCIEMVERPVGLSA
jgi:NAD-dependent dihydropyrimidine dehydrogenase PreA subunit